MSLPRELLDELTAILRSVCAHEALACDSVRLSEEALASIAGNAVQVMSEPLERFQRACLIAAARSLDAADRPLQPVQTRRVTASASVGRRAWGCGGRTTGGRYGAPSESAEGGRMRQSGSRIIPLTPEQARDWLERQEEVGAIEQYFAAEVEDA